MIPLRHLSPNTKCTFSNSFSPHLFHNDFNTINLDDQGNMINKRNINRFNFNYNCNNYYDEIVKSFNFITFILRQKDNQIQRLKLKILELEKKINELNSLDINNKEQIDSSSNSYNKKDIKNNINGQYYDSRKIKQIQNSKRKNIPSQNHSNNHNLNNQNNYEDVNNNKNIFMNENNANVVRKIKTTSVKSNNRNLTEKEKNNYYNKKFTDEQANETLSSNASEHPKEKRNIIRKRKDPYHPNLSLNINNKYGSEKKCNNNVENKNNINTDNLSNREKSRISFDNTMSSFGRTLSKSNITNSDEVENCIHSKNDIKNFLKEVKNKLEPERFKKFIVQIKALTKNKDKDNNHIIIQIRNLLDDQQLIKRFEQIMKVNK